MVVTGKRNSGKTKLAGLLARELKDRKIPLCGYISPCEIVNGQKNDYFVCDIITGERRRLLTRSPQGPVKCENGFAFASDILKSPPPCEVLIADEIGPLEVSGSGVSFNGVNVKKIVVTARESLIGEVARVLNTAAKPIVINLDKISLEEALNECLKCLL